MDQSGYVLFLFITLIIHFFFTIFDASSSILLFISPSCSFPLSMLMYNGMLTFLGTFSIHVEEVVKIETGSWLLNVVPNSLLPVFFQFYFMKDLQFYTLTILRTFYSHLWKEHGQILKHWSIRERNITRCSISYGKLFLLHSDQKTNVLAVPSLN